MLDSLADLSPQIFRRTNAVTIGRRSLLKYAALAPFASGLPSLAQVSDEVSNEQSDYTLRIVQGI